MLTLVNRLDRGYVITIEPNVEFRPSVTLFREPNATGISSHADNTIIKGNTITNAAGAGVRVGTTVPDETGHFHGIDNTVGLVKAGSRLKACQRNHYMI